MNLSRFGPSDTRSSRRAWCRGEDLAWVRRAVLPKVTCKTTSKAKTLCEPSLTRMPSATQGFAIWSPLNSCAPFLLSFLIEMMGTRGGGGELADVLAEAVVDRGIDLMGFEPHQQLKDWTFSDEAERVPCEDSFGEFAGVIGGPKGGYRLSENSNFSKVAEMEFEGDERNNPRTLITFRDENPGLAVLVMLTDFEMVTKSVGVKRYGLRKLAIGQEAEGELQWNHFCHPLLRSDYYPYHEEPPYDTPSRNFGYSPYQDPDGEDYYEPHGDQDDYDQSGPMYDNQPDPLVEEIVRLEQKIIYFDEVLFAEGSWYEPPYSRDYTLFAEEQIEANKVAIRERAKLLESVRKEKESERRLCEGSEIMEKMQEDDFQRERLEAESKADKLVNDLCMAVELKRSLQSQDQIREINVQKEALGPKTNPEPVNQQVPVLEDSPSFSPSQKPESITTLARATVVMLPKSLPSQVTTSIVVQKVEPTEGPDSEPPMLSQEKEEEVLPIAINNHLLNCLEDTPPEEPVLEEIEPTTSPQDSNVRESKEEPIDEEKPTPSIETYAINDSSSDHTFFDSLLDG
ncbi:unnamed protein product, partial [Cuscuta campestris]